MLVRARSTSGQCSTISLYSQRIDEAHCAAVYEPDRSQSPQVQGGELLRDELRWKDHQAARRMSRRTRVSPIVERTSSPEICFVKSVVDDPEIP